MDSAQTAHNKEQILKALEKSLGNVTLACKNTGIGRRTYYEWLEKDEKFKETVNDIREITIDFVESQLHQLCKKLDGPSIRWTLDRIGRNRGYGIRQDISINDGVPTSVNVTILERGDKPKN